MEGASVVADRKSDAGSELVVDADAVEQAVRPLQVGIGIAVPTNPERRVGRGADLVLLRDVVAVEIRPRARVGRLDRGIVAARVAVLILAVFAEAGLDGCLPAAAEVVGRAETRRPVVVVDDVPLLGKMPRDGEAAGRLIEGGEPVVEMVEAQPGRNRNSAGRPRILDV